MPTSIPEEPDEVNIQPVLACMECRVKTGYAAFHEILRGLDGHKPKIRFLKPYDTNYFIPNRSDRRVD